MMGFGRNKISNLKIVRKKKLWKDLDFIIWIVPFILVHLSSILIASTLRNLGLEIFTIKPSFKNRTFWSQGTVAISKFDKNKLKPNFNFEKLSLMEEEHLLTKASIPYRDQDLNSSKDDIIRRRIDEQLLSNLLSTNKWREKWGMTKLSFKS